MDAERVIVHPVDQAKVRLELDSGVGMELQEQLTFFVPGYQHMPKYRAGAWDGTISLYSPWKRTLPRGLLPEIAKFCEKRGYELDCPTDIWDPRPPTQAWRDNFLACIKAKLKPEWSIWDHQEESMVRCAWSGRSLLLSPTSSGKSLIIYALSCYARAFHKPVLIIVPTKGLVKQMMGDFRDYANWDFKDYQIMGGVDKNIVGIQPDFVCSTWQSIYKMPREWFAQFGAIIGDEAHHFTAECVKSIMENAVDVGFRWGTTATTDNKLVTVLSLNGLFGPLVELVTLKQLMDMGHIAKLRIRVVVLKYGKESRKKLAKFAQDPETKRWRPADYTEEVDFLVSHPGRMQFTTEFPGSLRGNVLTLFRLVEKHGKPMAEIMEAMYGPRFKFVHGGTDVDDRETIRKSVEEYSDLVMSASMGVFSTGVNMKNLRHLIMASPVKGRVKLLQSIGRSLRLTPGKTHSTLWDIADDLRYGSRDNYAWRHLEERMKEYDAQGFDVEFVEHTLE